MMDIDENNLRQAVEQEWHCKLGDNIKKQILLALDRLTAAETLIESLQYELDDVNQQAAIAGSERDQLRAQVDAAKGQVYVAKVTEVHPSVVVLSWISSPEVGQKLYSGPRLYEETMFQSAVSGLWYEHPLSCGDVSAVKVAGKIYGAPIPEQPADSVQGGLEVEKLTAYALNLMYSKPSPNKADVPKKYFVFDPEGSMEEIYNSREEAEAAKDKLLEEYQEYAADYGYHEATNRIFWGEVIQEVEVYTAGEKILFEGEMVDCYRSRWIAPLPPLKDE